MSEWKARRFWDKAAVESEGAGFRITLDGRAVLTPGKLALILPSRTLAERVAAEWNAQEGVIDPGTMPFTRLANSAVEKVAPQRVAVAEMLAGYADTDATCYRADSPQGLVERQAAAWDPLLDWAAEAYGGRLVPVAGVMHQPQSERALQALSAPVFAMEAFELTGFHDLVSLTGSLVIGLAARDGHLPGAELWARSRIDETWQEEQWGTDEEAAALAEAKAQDFQRSLEFLAELKD